MQPKERMKRDEFYRERVGAVPAWSDRVTDTPERRRLAEWIASGEPMVLPPFPALPTIKLPKDE